MLRLQLRSVALLLCAYCALAQTASQPQYEILADHDVMITMRDGVKLACDIYRPAQNGKAVEGKFPVIMERTPYGKKTSEPWVRYFVPRGYVGVAQDVRGRYESEGHWWP